MATTHYNRFDFLRSLEFSFIQFNFSPGDYCITDGQPWVDVVSISSRVNAIAGRKGSKKCADWFKSRVNNNYNHIIHTSGGDNLPRKLNFAFGGKLTIDSKHFEILMGQGHHGSNNNWYIASNYIWADSDAKNGTIGFNLPDDSKNGIRLLQDGTSSIKVCKSIFRSPVG